MTPIFTEAAYLREKHNLDLIPNNKPGYYKWWADKAALQIILNKLDMNFDAVGAHLEKNGDMYCIYVGVAIKESLKARLDWHINQKHKYNQIKSGTLSTLRQTISSIVSSNMADEIATNEFIDKLTVEYYLYDYPIKSKLAFDEIHRIEQQLLTSNHLYILNIQGNSHPLAPKNKLRELRKISKAAALRNNI